MPIDYSRFSDQQLEAMQTGDYSKFSDAELAHLSGEDIQATPVSAPPQHSGTLGIGSPWPVISSDRSAAFNDPTQEASFMRDVVGQTAKDIGKAAINFIPSATSIPVNMAKGAWNAGKEIINQPGNVIGGAYEMAKHPIDATGFLLKNVIVDPFMNRYGSAEATRKTAIEDPAGMLLDESAIAGGVGGGIGLAGKGARAVGALNAADRMAEVGNILKGGAGKIASIPAAPTAGAIGGAAKILGGGAKVAGLHGVGDVLSGAGDPALNLAKQGIDSALTGIKPVVWPVAKIGKTIDKVATATKTTAALNSDLEAAVQEGMSKGVGRTYRGKDKFGNIEKDQQQSVMSVKAIVGNKNGLELTNAEGDTVPGALPETLMQHSQATQQAKQIIFEKYDAMKKAAGEKGAMVDLSPAVNELTRFAEDPVLMDKSPQVAQYAIDKAAALAKRGAYTTAEAQRAIASYNADLDAYYKNPDYNAASRVVVDSMTVNHIRKGLDGVIENTVAPGYQDLKNDYGALTSTEADVTKRAIREGRKAGKGLIDFTDIFTAGEAAKALAGHASIAPAVTMAAVKTLYKRLNNPDRYIKNMFKDAYRIMNHPNFKTPSPAGFPKAPTTPLQLEDMTGGLRVGQPYEPTIPGGTQITGPNRQALPAPNFPKLIKGPDGQYYLPPAPTGFTLVNPPTPNWKQLGPLYKGIDPYRR